MLKLAPCLKIDLTLESGSKPDHEQKLVSSSFSHTQATIDEPDLDLESGSRSGLKLKQLFI